MRDFGFYEKFGYKLGLHYVTTKKNSEMQTFVKLEDFKKKKNYKQCVSSTLQYQREALVKTTVSSQRSREGGRGESSYLHFSLDPQSHLRGNHTLPHFTDWEIAAYKVKVF